MNKYCTNCGNKLDENADFCVKCGKLINKSLNKKPKTDTGEIMSILGMVFGIFSFIVILLFSLDITYYRRSIIDEILIIKIILVTIFYSFPLIIAIPGLILSITGEKRKKSIYGIIGLIGSLLTILFSIVSIIYIIC